MGRTDEVGLGRDDGAVVFAIATRIFIAERIGSTGVEQQARSRGVGSRRNSDVKQCKQAQDAGNQCNQLPPVADGLGPIIETKHVDRPSSGLRRRRAHD